MFSSSITSITPPTPPSPRSLESSSSTFPATLHTFPIDVGTTTNTSARTEPIPQEKKVKKTSHTCIPARVQRHARARFILKLHSIITLPNAEIIQWSNEGRAFTINHPALFEEKLLPEIFAHNSYASFERQLHFYS
jgi:hypothetical protein